MFEPSHALDGLLELMDPIFRPLLAVQVYGDYPITGLEWSPDSSRSVRHSGDWMVRPARSNQGPFGEDHNGDADDCPKTELIMTTSQRLALMPTL